MSKVGDIIYNELISALGKGFVSNDPALRVPYSRDQTSSAFKPFKYPDYVVIPKNVNEVKLVIDIANKYKISIIPWSTGANVGGKTLPLNGGILMEFKRMNQIIEIDEETMTATVEPYVSCSRLQTEVKKRGFRIDVPGAPSSVGVISNYCTTYGMHFHSNKYGWGAEKIVGLEMVLPSGDILRTGYLAMKDYGAKNIGANCLGMDLSGLPYNALGTNGIVTKMTVKLFPIYHKRKIIFATFKKFENAIKAYAEVAKEELGIGLGAAGPAFWCTTLPFKERDEAIDFLKRFHKTGTLVWVEIEGTQNQIEYQERITIEIFKKFRASFTIGNLLTQLIDASQEGEEKFQKMLDQANTALGINLAPYWVKRSLVMFDISEAPCRNFVLRGGLHMRETHNNFAGYLKQYKIWKESLDNHGFEGFEDGFWSCFISSYGASDLVCELDLLSDPQDKASTEMKSAINKDILPKYLKIGAYHIDSHGDEWANLSRHYGTQYTILKRMKKLLDPNNIMHTGNLYP